jgi:hypothetical protein
MIFISYRQRDEPFGVGLLHSVLAERFSPSPGVFLDTLANRRKWRIRKRLAKALESTQLMVCVVGLRFEELQRERQGRGDIDWVSWEVQQAKAAGIPVVPVLVRRQTHVTPDAPEPLGTSADLRPCRRRAR